MRGGTPPASTRHRARGYTQQNRACKRSRGDAPHARKHANWLMLPQSIMQDRFIFMIIYVQVESRPSKESSEECWLSRESPRQHTLQTTTPHTYIDQHHKKHTNRPPVDMCLEPSGIRSKLPTATEGARLVAARATSSALTRVLSALIHCAVTPRRSCQRGTRHRTAVVPYVQPRIVILRANFEELGTRTSWPYRRRRPPSAQRKAQGGVGARHRLKELNCTLSLYTNRLIGGNGSIADSRQVKPRQNRGVHTDKSVAERAQTGQPDCLPVTCQCSLPSDRRIEKCRSARPVFWTAAPAPLASLGRLCGERTGNSQHADQVCRYSPHSQRQPLARPRLCHCRSSKRCDWGARSAVAAEDIRMSIQAGAGYWRAIVVWAERIGGSLNTHLLHNEVVWGRLDQRPPEIQRAAGSRHVLGDAQLRSRPAHGHARDFLPCRCRHEIPRCYPLLSRTRFTCRHLSPAHSKLGVPGGAYLNGGQAALPKDPAAGCVHETSRSLTMRTPATARVPSLGGWLGLPSHSALPLPQNRAAELCVHPQFPGSPIRS